MTNGFYIPVGVGWVCPACRQIWAPWVPNCTCDGIDDMGKSSTHWDDISQDHCPVCFVTKEMGKSCWNCGGSLSEGSLE